MEKDGLPITELDHRLKELEKEAEFFRQIVDNTYDWQVFRDTKGKIVYVNDAFERITGFNVTDILDDIISEKELVHPDDYEIFTSAQKQSVSQKMVEDVNFRIIRKDGSIRYLNLDAIPVFKNDKFLGTRESIRDITMQKDFAELRASKEKAEDAEKQFKDFFEKAPDGIFIIETDTGIILNSNLSASRLLQTPTDQINGNPVSVFQPSLNRDIIEQQLADSRLSVPFENKVVKSDGSELPVGILVSEVTYEGKQCLMETFRDITARKEKEEELRVALQHLKFHINNSPFAVIEFNDKYQVTKWSENAEKIFGWTADEISGKTIQEIRWVHEDDAERVSRLIPELVTEKTSNTSVNRNYRKDGTVITCEWNNSALTDSTGALLSVHSLVRDITEREEYENKLEHSHRLMQYIIEHDRSAVALVDRDMKYIYVSKRFLTDYEIEDEDIIGKSHYEVFPDVPDRWKEIHQRVMKGEVISADEDPFGRDDGRILWIRWECRPWYESEGVVGGIILYTEVITKQKESELELIKAKEKAEESDRLKTAFLQNMSHEVRTPLNSIVGFSQLLSEPGQTPQEIKTFSEIILESSDKLIRIITDVIEISKIQAKQTGLYISKFDVVSTLNRAIKDFKEIANRKNISISLKQNIPDDKSFIITDSEKLDKIFTHLIDNAIKFTNGGSVEILSKIEKGNLQFSISDTGIGIPDELQRIIFEPFRQLESGASWDYGGIGLGLAIVKAYVKMLNGSLYLKSEKDKGTTFTVSIPLDKNISDTDEKIKYESPVSADPGTINTVLIAEDEYGNYRYLYEILHSDNMKILHAINGREAIEICRNNEAISLILMDIKMPLMDGKSAAKIIKEFRPGLPIIAQTAYALESEKASYLTVFDDLIAKPIRKNELKQKMEKYINV